LLRRYAAAKLAQFPAVSKKVCDRHAEYYATIYEKWVEALDGSRQKEAQIELETEGENIRIAWDWIVERGQVARLERSVKTLTQKVLNGIDRWADLAERSGIYAVPTDESS
jgi:hypothetical protein